MTYENALCADLEAAGERGEAFLSSLAHQRLFVTGGTGFVGRWLLELVTWANVRLGLEIRTTVLSRTPEVFAAVAPHLCRDPYVDYVTGDVRTFPFPSGRFAAVVHGAASSDDAWSRQHPAEAVDTIVSGTRRVLEFARSCGAQRFLFVSSGAVYGRQPAGLGLMSEEYQGSPAIAATVESAYGEAKRVAEVLAFLAAADGLGAVSARIFSCYGPFLPLTAHFAIGNFIGDALLGKPITVRGDGAAVRAYLYGSDLAVGLLACLMKGAAGSAYNIGGDEAVSMRVLADRIAKAAEPPVPVRILGQGAPSARFVPDTSRAREVLGFRPTVTLDEGIGATLRWARAVGAS